MVTVPVGSCGGVSGVDDGSVEHGGEAGSSLDSRIPFASCSAFKA